MSKKRKHRRADAGTKRPAAPPPPSSPSTSAPMRPFYGALRFVHLLIDAALLPLAVAHWTATTDAPALARAVVFGVSLLLSLFILVLGQADYPVSFQRAAWRTGPLVMNMVAALLVSRHDLLLSAYWATSAYVAALGVLLLVTTVLALRRLISDRDGGLGMVALVLGFFGGFGALSLVVTTVMLAPIAAAPSTWTVGQWLAGGAWLGQVLASASAWFRMSVFSKYLATPQSERRQHLSQRWMLATALLLMASLCALVFELAFDDRDEVAASS